MLGSGNIPGAEDQIKTSFEIHQDKYLEFKNAAAIKYKFKRGYTKKAIHEALELFVLHSEEIILPEDMELIHEIIALKGIELHEGHVERWKAISQELISCYVHVNQAILNGGDTTKFHTNFKPPKISEYRTGINHL